MNQPITTLSDKQLQRGYLIELRRIATALEEANKIKRYSMGIMNKNEVEEFYKTNFNIKEETK